MTDGKLLSGQVLLPERTLISVGGHAHLHNQSDGNLVSYLDNVAFWASQTVGQPAGRLHMDPNGNLVLYRGDEPYASTRTDGHPKAMVQLQDDGNFVVYEDPQGPQAGTPIWASSTGVFVIGECVVTPPPPYTETNRPLIGPLRIQDKMFRDDSGWRRVLFCSWFPALRILRDNPAEFERQINAIAAANYQGIRVFLAVGGWSDYWDGREVAPVGFQKWFYSGQTGFMRPASLGAWIDAWADYDDLLRDLLRACKVRKLRLHVTTGDMQIICPDPNHEIDLHRRFARICGEEGGLEVIAVAEATNEFPFNRYGSDGPDSITQMGRILDVWTAAIPGVLTMQGAIPANEKVASLNKASTYGPLCAVHVTRQPVATCLKHTFGLVYFEGNYRGYPKPFWEGEPAGPGQDSYDRVDDPASLIGIYAYHGLTGQASVRFQGAAVRFHQPLESEWGFTELPALLAAHLPEDVALWDHGSNQRGGIEYWWKGNNFRTVSYVDWDTAPPRPVASWTVYDGSVVSGTGTPPRCTGMIVGIFA